METYILRIYRRLTGPSEEIVGVSERVETGETRRFENLQQLNGIILDSVSKNKTKNRHIGNKVTPKPAKG